MSYPKIENESQLVKSLSKGNLLAFNTFYNEYSNPLYQFAFGYLKSEAEAEELVQEVFTKIWEKRTDLREELSFKSFIFTIAFNLIRKHFRTKAQIIKYFNSRTSDDSDMQTSEQITCNSLNEYISGLVNKLPARRKSIFIESRLEGLSIKEVAEKLKISHKTVENQLSDALKYIRTNLNREILPSVLFFILYIFNN